MLSLHRQVIVETRCHYANYRLNLDPESQTVGSLKQALSEYPGVAYGPDDCEFLFNGTTFPNNTPLRRCGVELHPVSKTHLTRIQLYFPVEVS